jgi:hypothetical protein
MPFAWNGKTIASFLFTNTSPTPTLWTHPVSKYCIIHSLIQNCICIFLLLKANPVLRLTFLQFQEMILQIPQLNNCKSIPLYIIFAISKDDFTNPSNKQLQKHTPLYTDKYCYVPNKVISLFLTCKFQRYLLDISGYL